jgi:hypothetical protein
MYHRLRKSFRTHRMVVLGYEAQMAARFVCLDIVVILMKIGACFALYIQWAQKSFWTRCMELLRYVGHMESHFGPFGCKIGAQFAPKVPKAQK